MSKRKPRSRKAASTSRASGRRVGPLWWGAGLLAIGWIALDANRPFVERHVPQLSALRLPWDAPDAGPVRREETPRRAAAARPAPPRPLPPLRPQDLAKPEHPAEPRQAALRAPVPAVKSAVPEMHAVRPAPVAPAPSATAMPAPAASGAALVTRVRTPLRRAPQAGAPVWMVLEPGRPLRITRREGGFARVESGIFTGWVEAAVLPEAVARPAPRTTMPTLATAEARRAGPVPAASVPGAAR